MSKVVLITGATGKQGGSVIDALLEHPSASQFTILAVTRDSKTPSAQRLLAKSDKIKVVEGNLDNVPALFQTAKEVAGGKPIWGVYSVQISMGKGVTLESEVKQGNDMIDQALASGVEQFVYSSVERGGDEHSWNNTTPIPHFQSKYHIEHHLRDTAGDKMGWTILRPVAFMDNLEPGFPSKVFLAALRDTMDGKAVQWVATRDIGFFAAEALAKPGEFRHKAIGLAGDELNFEGLQQSFARTTGSDAIATFGLLGSVLKYMVTELGVMMDWFKSDGYKADIPALRKMNPKMMDLDTWLVKQSAFKTIKSAA